jgi:hypothetical protein
LDRDIGVSAEFTTDSRMIARYYGVQQAERRLLNPVREYPDRNGEVDEALLVADHVLLGG